MKKDKTISRLFKDNQHKLNEAPSRQSWRRLERRLDDRRRYGKMTVSRQLGMVAALFLLGIVIALIAVLFNTQNNNTLAANYTLERLEELSETEQASQVIEFVQKYKDRLSNPVAEGDGTRRLAMAAAEDRVLSSRIAVSLADFQWLSGNWQQELNDQASTETWLKKNDYTLEGKGFLNVEGEKVQVDQMAILHLGSKIYFEMALQRNQKPVRYELKQFFADRIVFENKNIAFPQQLIFDIQAPNVYTLTLQNPELLDISDAQAKYLSQRNQIMPQRIVRVLERME